MNKNWFSFNFIEFYIAYGESHDKCNSVFIDSNYYVGLNILWMLNLKVNKCDIQKF